MTCKKCLYDNTVPNITFDQQGVCSYCRLQDEMEIQYPTGGVGQILLGKIVDKIKKDGIGKQYDCVIGISGGCDSSYLLHCAKSWGLRPLAVHFDNTWNSKVAVKNIAQMLTKLHIDLETYVMDNYEFNELARAMLLASVPEIDAISDVGFIASLYQACEKYKVKYLFLAQVFRTEGIVPLGWFYFDQKYIEDIYFKFSGKKIKYLPNFSLLRQIKWMLKGIKRINPLFYVDYNKEKAKKFLKKEYGWQWYGGHHLENRFTIFHHYLTLEKFGIDTRVVEASAMMRSGQMTRKQAEKHITEPFKISVEIIDKVKKRLGFSNKDFERIMSSPKKSDKDYKTYRQTFKRLKLFYWLMYKLDRVPKSFYVKYCQ